MPLLYIVNVIEASGSVWLDVYRFPRDVWLKELEAKQVTVIVIGKLPGKPSILVYCIYIGQLLMSIQNAQQNFLGGTTVMHLFQNKIYCLFFVLCISLLFSGSFCKVSSMS